MSKLEERIKAGAFVVTAELLAIDTGGFEGVRERFEPFAEYVDAVNATDNPAAHAHASSLAVAIALKELGMEPVLQLACRDRNRIALQADIAGAALHGIENLCCMTGDDVTAGDEPEARRVFDLDSIQLVALAHGMSEGRYLSGRTLDPPPHLFVGAVENPSAPPQRFRVDRAWKKVRAGARFLQLQVTFDHDELAAFMHEAVRTGLDRAAAIIPSVCLVRSPKALRFMDEKVPGISVPADVIARCEAAADAEAECFELAYEIATRTLALPGVAGVHLISFRREPGIARLCRRLGIPTRAEREMSGYRHPVAV